MDEFPFRVSLRKDSPDVSSCLLNNPHAQCTRAAIRGLIQGQPEVIAIAGLTGLAQRIPLLPREMECLFLRCNVDTSTRISFFIPLLRLDYKPACIYFK